MPSAKTNMRLLLLLALLCAAAYVMRRNNASWGAATSDSHLLPIDAAAISSFTISNADDTLIRCSRNADGNWLINGNKSDAGGDASSFAADSRKIDFILESLARANPQNRVSRKTRERRGLDLSHFGLDRPSATLTVSDRAGREWIVNFGDIAPSGDRVFAKVPAHGDVFSIDRVEAGLIPSSADDIRNRSLLTHPAAEITAIRISRPGVATIAAEKSDASADNWRITEPYSGVKASPIAIAALLDALSAATISKFVWSASDGSDFASAEDAAKTFALSPAEARAILSISYADGSRSDFRFGHPAPESPASMPAFSVADSSIFILDTSALAALPENTGTLAERRVFPVAERDASSISINARGKVFTLTRDADSGEWRVAHPFPLAADQAAAAAFVNGVLGIEAEFAYGEEPSATNDVARITIARVNAEPVEETFVSDLRIRHSAFSISSRRRADPATLPQGFLEDEWFASVLPTTIAAPGVNYDAVTSLRKNGEQEVIIGSDGEWFAPDNRQSPDRAAIAAIVELMRDFNAERAVSLWERDDFGLARPRSSLTVGMRSTAPFIVQTGAVLDDGSAYARLQGAAIVYLVSSNTAAILAADLTTQKRSVGSDRF